ncbi:MAG: winged helix DNA-binding domain-containing protein [Umezawaea sp.]
MATAFSSTRRRLTALRLSALGIDSPRAASPGEVVRNALATQAQDFPGALWSVGLRTPGATAAGVEAAHAAGDFVRSWPMRGTLHFVAPDDLGWMLGVTRARMLQSASGRRAQLGLGEPEFSRAEAIARDRLTGGGQARRAEMLAAFETGGVSVEGQRGVHILGQLAQQGLLVLASRDGWALLDEWVPHPRLLERDDALREFALRYFLSHGPATVRDFAWWSSLTLTDARAGLAAAREQLDELELDGTTYYLRPGLEPAARAVHLLPGFDEYLLGYTDRSAPLASEHANTIVPGGNGLFMPTVVVNGEVAGLWRREKKGKAMTATLAPFRPLTATATRAIRAELDRYARYLGTPVTLVEG